MCILARETNNTKNTASTWWRRGTCRRWYNWYWRWYNRGLYNRGWYNRGWYGRRLYWRRYTIRRFTAASYLGVKRSNNVARRVVRASDEVPITARKTGTANLRGRFPHGCRKMSRGITKPWVLRVPLLLFSHPKI